MMMINLRMIIVTFLVAVWLFGALLLFGEWELVFTLASMLLAFGVSAEVLREFYGYPLFEAILTHFRLVFGLLRGFQIIREGRTTFPTSPGPVMGPVLLIIGPNNCVILEGGSRQTRISGPAIFRTGRFEYVRTIYDLRQRQVSRKISSVMTSDLLETTVTLTATYGIRVAPRASRGERLLRPAEINMVQQVDSWMQDWEAGTRSEIEASVRVAVAALPLAGILAPPQFANLAGRILNLANRQLRPWGVAIQRLVVESVQPEQQVKDATVSQWVAAKQIDVENARATAWATTLAIIARAHRIATDSGMSPVAIHREVLRRTLETIAKDPATKIVITPELDSALSDLRRSVGL